MAEVAVNLVIDRLIGLLNEEATLLEGVHKEVEVVKLELEFISSFLRDADSRAMREENNDGVKTWVTHIREAAYSLEDVIDEYMLYVAKHRDQHGFKAFLTKIACLIKGVPKQHELASKIQELKRSVHEIGKKRKRYGFNISEQGESSRSHDLRAGLHFVDSNALVGIEPLKNELVGRLIHGEEKCTLISLVGMGGIGKTTLAKQVYDDQTVKRHFDCQAWVTVSQSYNMVERLRTMIRRLYEAKKELPPHGIDSMDTEELISRSREYLHDKRYVVVFHDVWNEDFWLDIESALPEYNNGSRIIITTRSTSVAKFCKKSSFIHVHNLEPLRLEMAQELLCRTAFQFDQQKNCPPELLALSFDIVRKCEGLPLAIVAIGGLLSTKGKDVFEWERLLNDLSAQLETNPHLAHVKKILSFSYLDLPHYLKSCFLYVGVFPQDYSIRSKRLIRLWIAEGLVKERKEMTLEEIAEHYLTMLIHRSLVQVEWSDSTGRIRYCRVHDLMHEVALSKLEELNLIQSSQLHFTSSNDPARYLSIYNGACDFSRRNGNFRTHSIIFFSLRGLPKSLFKILSLNFKLLREIDFERAPLECVPEELGHLLLLRYLSLRGTNVKMLPKSIGKLHYLQTLDLKDTLVQELPIEISSLCSLQYLAAYSVDPDNPYNINTVQGVKIKGSVIRTLESLEKLYYVDFQAQTGGDFFSALGRLKRLRKLGINKLTSDCGMALCDAIEQMHHLQALRISSMKEDELLQLQSMSSPPLSLQRLRLQGRLVKLPNWVSKLKNLVKISLHWSRISDDSLKILGGLPNLLEFWLHEGYDGAELHFEGQFGKLKYLGLRHLFQLNKLIIDEGSLPCLEILGIGPCPQLQEVPTNICNLKCLKAVEFVDMPKEFAGKILPKGGPDHWKVAKIPDVSFNFTTRGLYGETYKLVDFRLYEYLNEVQLHQH